MRMRSNLIAVAVLMLACSACVAAPYDGQVIAQSPSTVVPTINGFTTESEAGIRIYAKNSSGSWDHLATTNANTGKSWSWAGATWYRWELTNVNVPDEYWQVSPGLGGTATLKVQTTNGGSYISLKSQFSTCFKPTDTLQQFLERCQSSNSPEVRISNCGAFGCGGQL